MPVREAPANHPPRDGGRSMTKVGWLTIRPKDGPVWRQLLVGLLRGVAGYAAIGLTLALVALVLEGPGAWVDFYGHPSLSFAIMFWGLAWPMMLMMLLSNGH